MKLIPVAARSEEWVCGLSRAGIESSNPAVDIEVCCESCVLAARGLCDGLITRPEHPTECGDNEALANWGLLGHGESILCNCVTNLKRRPLTEG